MFQELLVADLVVADLTIENPNVWYELGVRHALRSRGVVIVCGGGVTTAFDLYTGSVAKLAGGVWYRGKACRSRPPIPSKAAIFPVR
jgi:hypothetical protein